MSEEHVGCLAMLGPVKLQHHYAATVSCIMTSEGIVQDLTLVVFHCTAVVD